MKAKLKTSASVSVVEAIQTGEPEIVVNGIAVILMVPGAELVGGLPPELQNYVLFTGGVSTTAKEPELGRALLNFLGTPAACLFILTNHSRNCLGAPCVRWLHHSSLHRPRWR
jgi:molybdate transport system substrate-binding protein